MAGKRKNQVGTEMDMEEMKILSDMDLEAAADDVIEEKDAVSAQDESTLQGEEILENGSELPNPEGLLAELEAAQVKQEEYLTMAQRVQADFENFRRRNQSVRKDAYDDGARNFAATLLPVLDNFERAVGAAQESSDLSLREGVEMVYRQLCDVFTLHGVTPIYRLGEKFDPNLENAVMQAEPGDGEPGTVSEVLQKGYQMGNSILRHAMVKVVPEQ